MILEKFDKKQNTSVKSYGMERMNSQECHSAHIPVEELLRQMKDVTEASDSILVINNPPLLHPESSRTEMVD